MAWLFLDTHESGSFRFGWLTGTRPRLTRARGRSHAALTRLALLWKNRPSVIDGICVVAGPGSFSAVRIGVLYANLFSRLLGKPLVGISVSDAQDLDQLSSDLVQGKMTSVAYVAPVYDAEPNITIPLRP